MALTDLFTSFQAADYCGVSYMTVKRWILADKLNAHRTPGGHYRILKRDLQLFMLKNSIPIPEDDEIISKKVLIIDDDKLLRNILEKYLKKQRFEVITAEDGYDACIKLNKYSPDIIILDLIMPKMNGFRICELIKNNPDTKDIKLIILTGYASEENIEKAYKYGVDYVLSKPVKVEDLLEKIYSLI